MMNTKPNGIRNKVRTRRIADARKAFGEGGLQGWLSPAPSVGRSLFEGMDCGGCGFVLAYFRDGAVQWS
jgi:hypothetical protein